MSNIPKIKLTKATVVFTKELFLKWPCTQSCLHLSINPVQWSTPAEKESKVPNAIKVEGSLPLNLFKTPIPIAIPIGVINANMSAITNLVDKLALVIDIILEDKAKPSKN